MASQRLHPQCQISTDYSVIGKHNIFVSNKGSGLECISWTHRTLLPSRIVSLCRIQGNKYLQVIVIPGFCLNSLGIFDRCYFQWRWRHISSWFQIHFLWRPQLASTFLSRPNLQADRLSSFISCCSNIFGVVPLSVLIGDETFFYPETRNFTFLREVFKSSL